MSPPDDILGETGAAESAGPGSSSVKPGKAPVTRMPPRTVGPESENRGGPEAPGGSLDDGEP